jgi:hypothetical protein
MYKSFKEFINSDVARGITSLLIVSTLAIIICLVLYNFVFLRQIEAELKEAINKENEGIQPSRVTMKREELEKTKNMTRIYNIIGAILTPVTIAYCMIRYAYADD